MLFALNALGIKGLSWVNNFLGERVYTAKGEPFGLNGELHRSRLYPASVVNRDIKIRLIRVSAHLVFLGFFFFSAQDLELHSAICFHT